MSSNTLPLESLCETAITTARAAATYIQSVDRSTIEPQHKSSGSSQASQVVTAIDFKSEAIIREYLLPACEQWDIAFAGEESALTESQARHCKSYFWCVDPLDGTQPYIEGRPGYAVSIALVDRAGTPLIGVVCDPINGEIIHAIRNQGAFINGVVSLTTNREATHALEVFADRSFAAEAKQHGLLEKIHHVAQQMHLGEVKVVYGNGAVKNACQVLRSPAACYIKLPKPNAGGGSIWDFSATACIAKESGGWCSSIQGQPLDLNRRGSTFMNHQGVLYASSRALGQCLVDQLSQ